MKWYVSDGKDKMPLSKYCKSGRLNYGKCLQIIKKGKQPLAGVRVFSEGKKK